MQPTLIMNLLLVVMVYGIKMRFIYAISSISLIVIVWLIINLVSFANASVIHSLGSTYGVTCVISILTGAIASYTAHETEYFDRMQFLMSKEMKKNNTKLSNQLKLISKSFNKKANGLDSPLEKSFMIIRAVIADPSLTVAHLNMLNQALTLLSSSNLLTPDFENQIGDSLDKQQKVYLDFIFLSTTEALIIILLIVVFLNTGLAVL